MTATIIKFPTPDPCARCGQEVDTLPCPNCCAEICILCSRDHTDAHEAEEGSGLDWSV